jgi:hypothetical protein
VRRRFEQQESETERVMESKTPSKQEDRKRRKLRSKAGSISRNTTSYAKT